MADKDREWDFTVHKDIMFDEEAEPEQGTKEERRRICVPFPFELTMPNSEALADFEIHVDGWKNFAYYSPGELCQSTPLTYRQPLLKTLGSIRQAAGNRLAPHQVGRLKVHPGT